MIGEIVGTIYIVAAGIVGAMVILVVVDEIRRHRENKKNEKT